MPNVHGYFQHKIYTMRDKLFKYGKRLARYIKLDGTGNNIEYYTLKWGEEEIPMRIKHTEEGTEIYCTCKHCSIRNNKYWCAAKTALVLKKSR